MEMDNGEIVRNYRAAKNKNEQIKILADLNACSSQDILDILTEAGAISGCYRVKSHRYTLTPEQMWTKNRLVRVIGTGGYTMSVLIKGMKMPKSCFYCPFREKVDPDTYTCMALNKEFEETFSLICGKRHKDCPLIEVPTPHSDLIDREELLNDAGGVYTARPEEAQKIQHEINKVLFAIQDAPTVIEAEGE